MKTCIKLVLLHVAYPFAHAKRALRPSGVTTASATPAMQGWHLRGGGAAYYRIYCFLNEKSFDEAAKWTISRPT